MTSFIPCRGIYTPQGYIARSACQFAMGKFRGGVMACHVRRRRTAGALHILMNIVGSNALIRFPKVDIDEWNKLFEINVTGTLCGIQTCAPLIKESDGGSIVNSGSVAGITVNFGTGYSSSKWAVEGLIIAIRGVCLCRLGHSLRRHPTGLDRNRSYRGDGHQPDHQDGPAWRHEQYGPVAPER